MKRKASAKRRFVICIKNTGYPAALELRKLYESLPDPDAEKTGMIRVIDESGEDYLYPTGYFAAIDLSEYSRHRFELSRRDGTPPSRRRVRRPPAGAFETTANPPAWTPALLRDDTC